MRTRVRNPFTTVQTSGLLLPVDLLARIVDGDPSLPGLTPDSYHLNAGERLNEAAARAWNTCVGNWKAFREASRKVPASDQGTTLTRDKWLLPLFRELGYGWLQANKRSLEIDGKPYPVSHQWQSHVPVHLVSFKFDVDRRTPGATGAAQRSPYSLTQEFLNRSAQHRWGFVSNGLKLVVLHDNVSLVRASNVEFDLDAMFEGEVYSDFILLFALCHQSRVEILAEDRPEECWLEKWSKLAEEQGTRAREKLRVGVERAIQALGTGFRTARGNTALNEALRTATLDTQEFYRELLRMVYRILLLLVAEDKRLGGDQNLLHPPDSSPEARRRYAQYYSLGRLRRLASQRRGTAHSDLYEALKVLFEKLRGGYAPLAIPGLGSFLFSPETTPHLDSASLSNEHLLEAIRHLCYTEDVSGRGGSVLRPVDFGNLGSEELGSVYESLLELHPRIDSDEAPFILAVAAGHERKTTGSYYTPTSLINCLLDSALDPVVEEALAKPNPEGALLNLKICDPSCGSGHFLIAAAERMAKHLARLRTGDDEPSLSAIQHAKRDIIGRCIYGVDLNPMAAELCRVSLWLEALEPGKPLSFLEHHIQVGNSLLGTTPELMDQGIPDAAFEPIEGDDKAICREYKKLNKDHRSGQKVMFDIFAGRPWKRQGNLAAAIQNLETLPDDTLEQIEAKARAYEDAVKSGPYQSNKLLADAWCAAFVWKKAKNNHPEGFLEPITQETFETMAENPHKAPQATRDEVRRLSDEYKFFHWHLAFPEVFNRSGFDVIIGNPPWGMTEEDSRIEGDVDLALGTQAGASGDPTKLKRERSLLSKSGLLPLSAQNRMQLARLFAELFATIRAKHGAAGMIIPSTVTVNAFDRPLWTSWVRSKALSCVWDFVNFDLLFPAVYWRQKFAIICLQSSGRATFRVRCWMTNPVQLVTETEQTVELSEADLFRYSGPEFALPHFRGRMDLALLDSAISAFGRLSESQDWAADYVLLGATNDRDFLKSRRRADEATQEVTNQLARQAWIPVYEGKMVSLFDHRSAHVVWKAGNAKRRAQSETLTDSDKIDAGLSACPLWEVPQTLMATRDPAFSRRGWDVALCDVTSALNERTTIAAVVPLCFATHNLPLVRVRGGDGPSSLLFLATLGSVFLDSIARLRVATNHLTEGIFYSLPIPNPRRIRAVSELCFGDERGIVRRVLELSYTAWDLLPLAKDCGWSGPPFRWEDDRRFLLRCELDAAFFHLYLPAENSGKWVTPGVEMPGDLTRLKQSFPTPRDAVAYVMNTFPIVRRKDEEKYHGDYRTKRVILEIYDAMQESALTGQPYQTRLDPPPGPPANGLPDWQPGQPRPENWPPHIHPPRGCK